MSEDLIEVYKSICGHLADRNAALFLGAGINFGTLNDQKEPFPLGAQLGQWICRDILGEPLTEIPLTDAAEIADSRIGRTELNDYLYKKFNAFNPGLATQYWTNL